MPMLLFDSLPQPGGSRNQAERGEGDFFFKTLFDDKAA